MSIRAMNWAWSIPLRSSRKVVLLALADIADDQGVCWPRQQLLARKSNTTERTLRRVLAWLASHALVSIEPQYRKDGSRSSNRYRLSLGTPPDTLSGGGVTRVRGSGQRCPEVGSPASGHRTTKEPPNEPSPPPPQTTSPTPSTHRGGGELIFSSRLTPSQRDAIEGRLAKLTTEQAQVVLDELAGRMAIVEVKNPLRYCAVLIRRLELGQFTPDLGIAVQEGRHIAATRAQALAKPSAPSQESVASTLQQLPSAMRAALERIRTAAAGRASLGANGSSNSSETPEESEDSPPAEVRRPP
jgi:hypothetical protein